MFNDIGVSYKKHSLAVAIVLHLKTRVLTHKLQLVFFKTKVYSMIDCLYCTRMCNDARTGHLCIDFNPTNYPEAREHLLDVLGPEMVFKTLKKRGNMAEKAENPKVTEVKTLVANADVAGLEALRGSTDMAVTYLIIAASNLMEESRAVGRILQEASSRGVDRRDAVIDVLIDLAKKANAPAEQPAEEVPFEADPPKEEKPAPKKRTRRKKAVAKPEPTPELDNAVYVADTALLVNDLFAALNDLQAKVVKIDTDLPDAFTEVVNRLDQANAVLAEAKDLAALAQKTDRNLARFRTAFSEFEQELAINGVIQSAPFTEATADWED